MNLDDLLAPIRADAPCGENLEYDPDYLAMEQASQGKAEQQFGDEIFPAEPADWQTVERQATGLLSRTKDLRIILLLMRAWTHRRGLAGYADGLELLAQTLTRYWAHLHPQPEEEGDYLDRSNALAALGDRSELTAALRQAFLLRQNGEQLTLREAQALLDGSKNDCPDYPGGRERLQTELARGTLPGAEIVAQIHARLSALRAQLIALLGESGAPEMARTLKMVAQVADACQATDVAALLATANAQASQPNAPSLHAPVAPPVSAPAPTAATAVDWRRAAITSRADAWLMLDKIRDYFLNHEPSHPAPLLIERVQRLAALDFMDIIRDLAPDSVSQLETIFGRHD